MQKKLPFLTFMDGKLALDNAPAFCDDASDRWLRYGELREKIRDLTPRFHPYSEHGKRSLILCALPRTIDGVIAYLSAVHSGHALLMIDPDTSRLDLFVEAYKPDWVITTSKHHLGESFTPENWPITDIFLWRRSVPSRNEPHKDLCLMLLPPGPPESITTVRLSYNNIATCLEATTSKLPFSDKTRSLIHMPLSYSFGLSVLHMTLSVGGRCVFTEHGIKDRKLWTVAREREVTLFAGVPFHFEYIARAGLSHLHAPSIKAFLQAGGCMPKERVQEILRQVSEREGQFYVLYGMTEAAPRISIMPVHEYPEKCDSVGKVIDGGDLWIEDGFVTYQGPNVMIGYAGSCEDITQNDRVSNVLRTEDRGWIDEEGFLFLDPK